MFTGHSLLHTHKSEITGLSATFSILSPPPPSFPSCMFILLLCISHITSSLAICWPVFLSSPNWQRNTIYLAEMSSTEKYWHFLKNQFVFSSQTYHMQLSGTDLCPHWPNLTEMACQRLENLLRNGYLLYGNIPITISCGKHSITLRDRSHQEK